MNLSKIFSIIMATLIATISTSISLGSFVEARDSIESRVEQILSKMTLEEKIGQMICIGVRGTDLDSDARSMLTTYKPGGIILFDRNCESEDQLKKLTSDLQKNSKLPLLIAIDEEGGVVSRAKNIIEPPPSQLEIAQSGDIELAKTWAIKTSQNLRDLGINLNFAPVLDTGYHNPRGRSFGDDPNLVRDFARSAIDGYLEEDLLCTLKHFPGIGRGTVDSHLELSDIDATHETLESNDLIPFRSVISDYPAEKYLVMISHFKYPALDSENPASLSKNIITDLLRNELGYDGIIITDNLEMGAISKTMPIRDAGVRAILAGIDIALVCHEYDNEREVYDAILDAVRSGKISEDRIDESVRRILRTKISAGLF